MNLETKDKSNIGLILIGAIILLIYVFVIDVKPMQELKGLHRIIIALATAAVSIAIPGVVEIGDPSSQRVSSNVKASGALAVFVLVYLFNPIG